MKTKTNFMQTLEKNRRNFFFIGLTFSLAVTLAAFEWRTPYNINTEIPGMGQDDFLTPEDFPVIIWQVEKQPEISKPQNISASASANSSFEITETDIAIAETPTIPEPDDNPGYVEFPDEFVDERDNIFIPVEQMPAFPGGETEFMKFLKYNIHYPKMSKELGITGTVYVEFIVDVDGSIINTKIAKGVSSDIDKEALRVVNAMPKWIPGSQRNKTVQVGMRLPIRFTLM